MAMQTLNGDAYARTARRHEALETFLAACGDPSDPESGLAALACLLGVIDRMVVIDQADDPGALIVALHDCRQFCERLTAARRIATTSPGSSGA